MVSVSALSVRLSNNAADHSDVSLHFCEVNVPHRPWLDLEGVASYTVYKNNSIYQLHNCLIKERENAFETLNLDCIILIVCLRSTIYYVKMFSNT
jgi:hypothetical protein